MSFVSGVIQLPYHGLLTDLDNTLYDFAAAQEYGCRAAVRSAGVGSYEELMTALLFSVHGVESHTAVWDYLMTKGISDDMVLSHACREYEEAKIRSIVPYPGVIEGIKQIHSAGIKICAISNAQSDHARSRLLRMDIDNFIHVLVTPDTCGYRKPDPGIFLKGADEIGISHTKICVLGDNLLNDIAPAQALGMYTVHARYGDRLPPEFAGDTIPDAVIDSFYGILRILKIDNSSGP